MTEEQLLAAVKDGSLEINQENLEAVQNAYCESIIWTQAFKDLGLDNLPDPEGISEEPQIYEDWLVKVFEDSVPDIRDKLHLIRDRVIKGESPT